MLTTEADARKKWCPLARVEGNNRLNNALNDGFENTPEPYHCIGSRCMMWREIHSSHLKGGAAKTLQGHGFCGVGGRPELEQGF